VLQINGKIKSPAATAAPETSDVPPTEPTPRPLTGANFDMNDELIKKGLAYAASKAEEEAAAKTAADSLV